MRSIDGEVVQRKAFQTKNCCTRSCRAAVGRVRSLCGLRQTIIHCGKDRVTGHGAAGHSIHTGGTACLFQAGCQAFRRLAAQFRRLARSINVHIRHFAAGDGHGDRHIAQAAFGAGRVGAIGVGGRVVCAWIPSLNK